MKLSIIIPCLKDPLLQKTIDSLLDNSELGNDMEVLAVLDGYRLETPLKNDPRVRVIKLQKNYGMRGAINVGLKESKGEYFMSCDSHCLFAPGYDKILTDDCRKDWLMVPRRYSLDEKNWDRDLTRPARDYHRVNFPSEANDMNMSALDWYRGGRSGKLIDNTLAFQGSCVVAHKEYFMKRVGYLDDKRYGTFMHDQLEMGLKYWLGGGQIKVNKKTWYAHLTKRRRHYIDRIYTQKYKQNTNHRWITGHWINDREPGMIHTFEWLINKFNPPGWSPGWQDKIKAYNL